MILGTVARYSKVSFITESKIRFIQEKEGFVLDYRIYNGRKQYLFIDKERVPFWVPIENLKRKEVNNG